MNEDSKARAMAQQAASKADRLERMLGELSSSFALEMRARRKVESELLERISSLEKTRELPAFPAPYECELCEYRLNPNGTCPNETCKHRKPEPRENQ